MSDIASSLQKIQVEGTRFRSATSESLFQTMGGSINGLIDAKTTNDTTIAYILNKLTPVGTIVHSMLTESQFQTEANNVGYGIEWVLADGRSVTGSEYQTITGNANIPDLRGIFLRGKNNGRSTATGDATSDWPLGQYIADGVKTHTHTANVSDPGHTHNFRLDDGTGGLRALPNTSTLTSNFTGQTLQVGVQSGTTGITVTNTNNAGGTAENRPRYVVVNIFIRIN